MESQPVLASDALALCRLCLTPAVGFLSWERTMDWCLFCLFSTGKEAGRELIPISWQCNRGCWLVHSWKPV